MDKMRLPSMRALLSPGTVIHGEFSGVTGGAECPPETSDREIFTDVWGKKRQGEKGKGVKIEKKRRKIVKRK